MTRAEAKALHEHSSYHRSAVERSEIAGCFYCLGTFSPRDIKEWIDKDQTALCPKCGIDSVLPAGMFNDKVLVDMYDFWFR